MSFVEWSDSLSVGVDEIDDQHKSLVSMLNELHDAVTSGNASVDLPAVIEKMKGYAMEHFATEERHMKRKNYPDLLDHMSEHAFFVSKVKDFTAVDPEQADMLPEVMDFLKEWLVDHILNIDAKMGRYLRGTP